jgi:hypothetical protein
MTDLFPPPSEGLVEWKREISHGISRLPALKVRVFLAPHKIIRQEAVLFHTAEMMALQPVKPDIPSAAIQSAARTENAIFPKVDESPHESNK